MSIALYTLTSGLHTETARQSSEETFIRKLESSLGEKFEYHESDFSSYGSSPCDIIYVRTGGTEGQFRALGLPGYVRLLTSGESNSLAASMEILSFLRQQGRQGEILHGSPQQIAEKLRGRTTASAVSPFVVPFPKTNLGGIRLGVIGKPSDWLISSDVDYAKARARLNVELVDVPMAELLAEIRIAPEKLPSFEGSEAIYEALKVIVDRYRLSGLTLRCFDLLDSVHNTGCLALARLNAEGLPSSCEGDVPALLSMAYLMKTYGCPGFQCNLSRIDGDELLFAHCTVPLSMVSSYKFATHFESGIGTAVKGELPLGKVEVFKISPDLETCVRIPGEIIRNESRENLCRTQIVVRTPAGAAEYFLHTPLANHHIIF